MLEGRKVLCFWTTEYIPVAEYVVGRANNNMNPEMSQKITKNLVNIISSRSLFFFSFKISGFPPMVPVMYVITYFLSLMWCYAKSRYLYVLPDNPMLSIIAAPWSLDPKFQRHARPAVKQNAKYDILGISLPHGISIISSTYWLWSDGAKSVDIHIRKYMGFVILGLWSWFPMLNCCFIELVYTCIMCIIVGL